MTSRTVTDATAALAAFERASATFRVNSGSIISSLSSGLMPMLKRSPSLERTPAFHASTSVLTDLYWVTESRCHAILVAAVSVTPATSVSQIFMSS